MPTYEFRCANGHDFEQFHRKISDAPSTVPCPTCDAVAERRVSGGAGLLFKGSGFYLTDYGKNAHRAGSAKPDAAKADAGGAKAEGGAKGGDGAASTGGASAGGASAGGASAATPAGGSSSSGASSPAKGDA